MVHKAAADDSAQDTAVGVNPFCTSCCWETTWGTAEDRLGTRLSLALVDTQGPVFG